MIKKIIITMILLIVFLPSIFGAYIPEMLFFVNGRFFHNSPFVLVETETKNDYMYIYITRE